MKYSTGLKQHYWQYRFFLFEMRAISIVHLLIRDHYYSLLIARGVIF